MDNKAQFPVMWGGQPDTDNYLKYLGCPRFIPWEVIEPHREQAQRNHRGQTLERLAERGGLCPVEMVSVLNDRPYPFGTSASYHDAVVDAVAELKRRVREFEGSN